MLTALPLTQPLRCLVVDDDPLACQVLLHCIAQEPGLVVVGTCYGALEALEALRAQPVDVLFLDIELPLVSGLELLHLLLYQIPRLPHTVLVSSHAGYALQAFDYAVADYLLKPVALPRFQQAVRRVAALAAASRLATPPPSPPAISEPTHLLVKVGSQSVRVDFASVCYLEAAGSYVHIVTPQQRHTVFATLRSLVERFPRTGFFTPHRSYLVNLRYIEAVEERDLLVQSKRLPISSLLRAQLLEHLNVL